MNYVINPLLSKPAGGPFGDWKALITDWKAVKAPKAQDWFDAISGWDPAEVKDPGAGSAADDSVFMALYKHWKETHEGQMHYTTKSSAAVTTPAQPSPIVEPAGVAPADPVGPPAPPPNRFRAIEWADD